MDVLWLHRRAPSEVGDFERKVRELGFDPAALVFPGTETDNVLSRGFAVSSTPWLALAMPDGRLVHEERGCRTVDGQAKLTAWLDAWQKP